LSKLYSAGGNSAKANGVKHHEETSLLLK